MQRYYVYVALMAAVLACVRSAAAAEAFAEPFDCLAGLSNSRAGWSQEKKCWCCQNYNLGCNESAWDKTIAPHHGVERYGPGNCVSTWKTRASHCVVQTDCAEQNLSRYPIALLCVDSGGGKVRHVFGEGSFAPEETFDTLIVCEECKADIGAQTPRPLGATGELNATLQGFVREVDEIKRRALHARIEVHRLGSVVYRIDHSHRRGRTAPTSPERFDCDAGLPNLERGWSDAKKRWCCQEQHVGCETEVPHPKELFRCDVAFKNREKGWSENKKRWCCQNTGIGCELDPYDCVLDFDNREMEWSKAKKYWCCQKHHVGCTPDEERFDCFSHLYQHETHWSTQKKNWCCQQNNIGCSLTEVRIARHRLKHQMARTASQWTPLALPGHRQVVVSHDARASWNPSDSPESSGPVEEVVETSPPRQATAQPKLVVLSDVVQEAEKLQRESQERLRELDELRQQYETDAIRTKGDDMAARAIQAAEAAEISQKPSFDMWSGGRETEDEAAARVAKAKMKAWSTRATTTSISSSLLRRMHRRPRHRQDTAPQEPHVLGKATPRDEVADVNAAAFVAESYARDASVAVRAVEGDGAPSRDVSEGAAADLRMRRSEEQVDTVVGLSQRHLAKADDMWWDSGEDPSAISIDRRALQEGHSEASAMDDLFGSNVAAGEHVNTIRQISDGV